MSCNPFQAGVYDGKTYYHTSAEDRVVVVQRLNRAECEAGLKVDDLQKSVVAALQRRLRKLAKVVATIHFEDHGQDFLEWDLDATGKIIECRPFQASLWCGRLVINSAELRKGSKAVLEDGNNIRYPLVKVERFTRSAS